MRLPVYTHVEAAMMAQDPADALDVLQKGRIRYLLTVGENETGWKKRYPEEIMAHDLARSDPDRFELVDRFPLSLNYGSHRRRTTVYLWEYLDELPPGESELAIIIPTARLTLGPEEQAEEPRPEP